MSTRFLELARREGHAGHLVHAVSDAEGPHWFAVISSNDTGREVAVDWTAPQFYNAGYPDPPADPADIPCPLIFDWPGVYPLIVVSFESHHVERPA